MVSIFGIACWIGDFCGWALGQGKKDNIHKHTDPVVIKEMRRRHFKLTVNYIFFQSR